MSLNRQPLFPLLAAVSRDYGGRHDSQESRRKLTALYLFV